MRQRLSRYKLPGPDYVAYVFVCLVVSIFVDLQINLFRPSPSRFATEHQSFRFNVKIVSSSALAGERKRRAAKIFSTVLEQQIDCLLF